MASSSLIEWYNENHGRSYPVAEAASKVDTSGDLLPSDIVVDMGLMVPPDWSDVYISSLRITPLSVTIGLSSGTTGLFVGTYLRSDLETQIAYPLTALLDNLSGWIVFGNHVALGVENYQFNGYGQAGLERRVIRVVDVLPVTRFMKYGGNAAQFVDDVVTLIPGAGVQLVRDDVYPQKIIVKLKESIAHAMVGPCNSTAVAEDCGVPPLRSINGVCPDEDGKITIRFE